MHQEQLRRVREDDGFIAALDQSGGSTPKALGLYGIADGSWSSQEEMFDLMHAMRSRIMLSSAFSGDRVLGAILFEMTMDREVAGLPTATYLWEQKRVVPFLKIDKGLADLSNGVQMMKAMPDLASLLDRAVKAGIFGTKMRSVIASADSAGVAAVVAQQFEIGQQVLSAGLVPIIEPEVDIHAPDKAEAEEILRQEILAGLNNVDPASPVMLKLTLPEVDGLYDVFVDHPSVARVVALSGGYSRDDANERLSRNRGVIASFSRALTEGLHADQSDEEFDAMLDASIEGIFQASRT
ncbi:MAG: fructose bisphosphate aldolase [Actinobacteria bacterium]|nr:fructose bisphosphate aldolase [Actinomycetota bacterium]